MEKIEKKFLAFLFILALFIIILVFWLSANEKRNYTSLSIPQASDFLLERLTPKDHVPPIEEERKETERLLEDLTPKNAKSGTESQKETEKLLEQLRPR